MNEQASRPVADPAVDPAVDSAAGSVDVAGRFARFAASLTPADIPEPVLRRAKLHILDGFGIALASTTFDFAQHAANAIAGLAGAGELPVIGMPLRLPIRDAVHLNGTLIHGLDFDDTHSGAVTHITASVWPTEIGRAHV